MQSRKRLKITVCIALGVTIFGGLWVCPDLVAQSSSSGSSTAPGGGAEGLKLQRSVALYNYKTVGESGAARGEEFYYIKCWMCHNQYTIKAQTGAVPLKDLYKRPRLTNGQPVNDQTVAAKIRNGGPAMPAYRYVLNDQDMADLLSYLREKCCFEGDNPPPNPWYRY